MKLTRAATAAIIALTGVAVTAVRAPASSHREAPFITTMPKEDNTDVYVFRSYETGRQDYVTIVADYQPFQEPFGGPNYYTMDPRAAYDINIDNVGDGTPHMSFRFRFTNTNQGLTVPVGGQNVAIPLVNIGPTTAGGGASNLNVSETYTVTESDNGSKGALTCSGSSTFTKPTDNIGNKSFPDYQSYANQYIYNVNIPGCATQGRLFVGQRKDPFVVNLGETFDLVNISNPIGAPNQATDSLAALNITSLIMELPISCITTSSSQPIIGVWATASLPRVIATGSRRIRNRTISDNAQLQQVSRLANPLVNELVIGLQDKDRYNSTNPVDDAQFAQYVTNPTVPTLLQVLFPTVTAPTLFPRADLVATFLTGLSGINMPPNVVKADEERLNTSTPVTPAASQNPLGVIGGDSAGYPNGRRPGDDVVDITLRVAMGVLINPLGLFGTPSQAPSGALPFTDGAPINSSFFDNTFPYVKAPIPGSPNGPLPNLNGLPPNGGTTGGT